MCSTTTMSLLFHIEHQTQTASLADFGTGAVSYAVLLALLFTRTCQILHWESLLIALESSLSLQRSKDIDRDPSRRAVKETLLDTPARAVFTFVHTKHQQR